jgi:hypothetical protein
MDGGAEPVSDPALLARLRAIGRRTWALAFAGAGALTAVLWFLPV